MVFKLWKAIRRRGLRNQHLLPTKIVQRAFHRNYSDTTLRVSTMAHWQGMGPCKAVGSYS
jgi:hypothetical protein